MDDTTRLLELLRYPPPSASAAAPQSSCTIIPSYDLFE
jgi:hypothetical protein